jgi:hypothetical protein
MTQQQWEPLEVDRDGNLPNRVQDKILANITNQGNLVINLGNSNGTDDRPALQTALDAVRTAGGGKVIGKSGVTYLLGSELVMSADTILDLSGSTVRVNNGTNAHAIRNYSEKNPVTTGTATTTSGSNVVTTALASTAVVGQMLTIAGAGGNGLGPLVGKVTAINTGAGTVTLTTLDGRPCLATAPVTAAAATVNNVDRNIKILVRWLDNGNNVAAAPGYGVIFLRHVDGLHIDVDKYTSAAVSRGVGLGSVTNFWLRIRQSNSASVTAQINGPAANGRVDYIKGASGDDLFAFTAGDYSAQQSTAGDIVNVTVGSVIADNTSLNVFKVLAGAGWLVDGIMVDGTISGTGTGQGACIGDDISQAQTTGGTYGEIDLGYVNLRTTSYPIALLSPTAKRIKAVVRHLPAVPGTQQAPVSVGGSRTGTIDELNLAGSVIGSNTNLVNMNNLNVTITRTILSDGVAGYAQTPLTTANNILAARVPIAPFVMGEAWSRADGASLGNVESSGAAWAVWAGTPGIVSRQAAPTATGNTKAVATVPADGYTEIIINALSSATGEGWLVFRGADTSNYWRFGFTTGTPPTLLVQKIVAGGATQLLNVSQVLFYPGIRLGVLHVGSVYTVYADGLQVGTYTDAFNQGASLAGFQSSDTPARFGPIYSRALVAGK